MLKELFLLFKHYLTDEKSWIRQGMLKKKSAVTEIKRSVAKIQRSQWEIMYNINFRDLCIKTSWFHTNYEITKACSFSPLTHKLVLYFHNEYLRETEATRFFQFSIADSFISSKDSVFQTRFSPFFWYKIKEISNLYETEQK